MGVQFSENRNSRNSRGVSVQRVIKTESKAFGLATFTGYWLATTTLSARLTSVSYWLVAICQPNMEDELLDRQQEVPEENNEEQPTYLSFRLGREERETDKCNGIVLAVFKVWFCSLGLSGHQAWNYVPRVLVCVICVYQAVYYLYVVIGRGGFNNCFLNSTDKENPTNFRQSVTEDVIYTISSIAALISYVFLLAVSTWQKERTRQWWLPLKHWWTTLV